MKHAKTRIVTGYCPIPGHPRTATEYGKLFEWYGSLRDRGANITPIFSKMEELWLLRLLLVQQQERALQGKQIKWAEYDNPAKNSLLYHCVQHQKFQWLLEALNRDGGDLSTYDNYVWMDIGIRRILSGEATNVVMDFLDRLKRDDMAIPGCWPQGEIDDSTPCWRFCGSMFVVPKRRVRELHDLAKGLVALQVKLMDYVSFEVNTLAHLEKTGKLPLRWYPGDHNDTMFTGY